MLSACYKTFNSLFLISVSICKRNTLDSTLINGKIVICTLEEILDDHRGKAIALQHGGGVGIILVDPHATDIGFQFVLPATAFDLEEAEELVVAGTQWLEYPRQRQLYALNQYQKLLPSHQWVQTSSLLFQPDITAPGVNILAAWSLIATDIIAGRSTDYNIASGTSMSCPHVSGRAAIVKASHPSWSPAAIKSFDYGSGHVNPAAATDPGLINDFDTSDVVDFL